MFRTGKVAQWVKALAAKPDNLSSIPGTLMVEGKTQLLKVFSDLQTHTGTCTHSHICIHTK